jgi:hypothetical protein
MGTEEALMSKAAIDAGRIEDDALRRNTFAQLKHELLKRAMELSILCDCDVQVFVHSARVEGGERATSTQFSSGNPEDLLAYIRTHPPAECFSKEDYVRSFSQVFPKQTRVQTKSTSAALCALLPFTSCMLLPDH